MSVGLALLAARPTGMETEESEGLEVGFCGLMGQRSER